MRLDVQKDRRFAQLGFTLIEVLIAMVILAVGLLALAGVMVSGIKSTNDAYMRTQASGAAVEMADRMRANMAGVNAGSYAAISSPPATTAPASCVGATATCTSAQIAAKDAYEWLSSLDALAARDLPGATGSVTCGATPCVAGSLHQITVNWKSRSGASMSYSMTFQP